MSIESHVVSLDLARELKEKGFPQEKMTFYRSNEDGNIYLHSEFHPSCVDEGIVVAAPLFTEIWERLPRLIDDGPKVKFLHLNTDRNGQHTIYYERHRFYSTPHIIEISEENTPQDAAAKAWLWLRERGLV